MAKCTVSLLQGAAYDWWKLVYCSQGSGTSRNPQGSSKERSIVLHRLVIGVEGKVVQGSIEEVLHKKS